MYFHEVKYCYFLLLLLLSSCTLNADQEASLNSAVSTYINAINNGQATLYVGFTYPAAVAYYENQGDSIFKKRFTLEDVEERSFLQDGNIMNSASEGESYQVHYEFLCFDGYYEEVEKKNIYAISDDNGISWFFIDEEDYTNDAILALDKRLIK